MFDEMRKNTKTILWITVIAFIGGFIFLDLGTGGSLFRGGGGVPDEIGRINGRAISATAYNQTVASQLQAIQQQGGGEIDEQLETLVRNQTWDNIVQQVLMSQEVDRLDIGVTDQEVIHSVLNDPPPEWNQLPQLQTNGQFDLTKYQAFLRSPGIDTRGLEAQARVTIPLQKLQGTMLATVVVPESELWYAYRMRNEKVDVDYLVVSANQFQVDEAGIGGPVVQAFYDAHRQDFELPREAIVEFVRIPKGHSTQDSLETYRFAQQVLDEVRTSGENFLDLVADYSEAPPSQRGGEAAAWVFPAALPQAIRDVVTALPVGEPSDVVTEPSGFHIIRIEEKEETGTGMPRFKIADIFLPLQPSPMTLDAQNQQITDLWEDAQKRDLAAAAAEHNLEVSTTAPFREGGFIPGLGAATQVGQFAFAATPGTISNPISLADSYVVVKLRERRERRVPDLSEVEARVRTQVADSLRLDQAVAHAASLLRRAQGGDSLRAIADGDSLATFETPEPFTRLSSPRGIGSDAKVLGPLFAAKPGLVPQVLRGRRGAYVARVTGQIPADRAQFDAQKDELRNATSQQRQNQFLVAWQEELRQRADVKDFRTGAF